MWYQFRPYVSQRERVQMAKAYAAKLAKKGHLCRPVIVTGVKIAKSFWGKAWCDHMESFHDCSNRLPRGRTYARNGSVFDLQIHPGRVEALVSGSEIYKATIALKPLARQRWDAIKRACAGQVASAVELLQGRFSDAVMRVLTDQHDGMFPARKDFDMECTCPDGAGMCKHIAAVIYGIGSRLDHQPDLFFVLRDVNHMELIAAAGTGLASAAAAANTSAAMIADDELSSVFGVDIEAAPASPAAAPPIESTATTAKIRAKAPSTSAAKQKGRPARNVAKNAWGKKSTARVSAARKARGSIPAPAKA